MDNSKRWITAGTSAAAAVATALVVRSVRDRAKVRPLETVAYVDLEQYQGRWFEIARYPAGFERRCAKNVTAEYTLLPNRSLRVVEYCTTREGRVEQRTLQATVDDRETNAKLTIKYRNFGPSAPYWIVDLDEDYHYAAVGEPRRRMLWILSRTPAIDDETMRGIYMRLQEHGYDTSHLEPTLQDGGLQTFFGRKSSDSELMQ